MVVRRTKAKGEARPGTSKKAGRKKTASKPKAKGDAPRAKARASSTGGKKAPKRKASGGSTRSKTAARKTSSRKTASRKAAPSKASRSNAGARKTSSRKAAPSKASRSNAGARKTSSRKAAPSKASGGKAGSRKAASRKVAASTASSASSSRKASRGKGKRREAAAPQPRRAIMPPAPTAAGNGAGNGNGSPALPRRDEELRRVDEACAAWAVIVTERMAADESFAEVYERFAQRPTDLRGLFVWDALLASEAHVRLINDVLRRHVDGSRRADPVLVLAELRQEQQRLAAAYAVNAFMAVLNNMREEKPRWQRMEDFDSAFAVLALAHQALEYALTVARVEAPADLMDTMLKATQHESVWAERREGALGSLTLAACAATAEFFRALGAGRLLGLEEVARLYVEHAESIEVRAEARRERALAATMEPSLPV